MKKYERTKTHMKVRVKNDEGKYKTKWIETDLMEWENGEVYNGKNLEIKLTPFGIKTWKVNL